ncbi:hypothetical protein C8R43DRAFT_1241093 [Mycena crocata]|nr:hypothetical protein C8R43DRAFT_1241093 [Mycena crocata]
MPCHPLRVTSKLAFPELPPLLLPSRTPASVSVLSAHRRHRHRRRRRRRYSSPSLFSVSSCLKTVTVLKFSLTRRDPVVLTPRVTHALPLLIDVMSHTNVDVHTAGPVVAYVISLTKPSSRTFTFTH